MAKKITSQQRTDLEKLSSACGDFIAKHGGNADVQEAVESTKAKQARTDKKLRTGKH